MSSDLTALIVIALVAGAPLLLGFLRWMMREQETEADPIADRFTKRKRDNQPLQRAARTRFIPEPPGIDWEAAHDAEIRRFLETGRKIDAIKRYRELSGVGLKESKDAIESLERRLM